MDPPPPSAGIVEVEDASGRCSRHSSSFFEFLLRFVNEHRLGITPEAASQLPFDFWYACPCLPLVRLTIGVSADCWAFPDAHWLLLNIGTHQCKLDLQAQFFQINHPRDCGFSLCMSFGLYCNCSPAQQLLPLGMELIKMPFYYAYLHLGQATLSA
eukprot:1160714-Pelagomonas_calceolata.AAC.31